MNFVLCWLCVIMTVQSDQPHTEPITILMPQHFPVKGGCKLASPESEGSSRTSRSHTPPPSHPRRTPPTWRTTPTKCPVVKNSTICQLFVSSSARPLVIMAAFVPGRLKSFTLALVLLIDIEPIAGCHCPLGL